MDAKGSPAHDPHSEKDVRAHTHKSLQIVTKWILDWIHIKSNCTEARDISLRLEIITVCPYSSCIHRRGGVSVHGIAVSPTPSLGYGPFTAKACLRLPPHDTGIP